MDVFRDGINGLNEDLRVLLNNCKEELLSMPAGKLRCTARKGRLDYKQAVQTDQGMKVIGINRNQELIAQLARKEYLQKLHDTAEWDAGLLDQLMGRYRSLDPEDIVGSLSRAARNLPNLSCLKAGKIPQDGIPDGMRWGDVRSEDGRLDNTQPNYIQEEPAARMEAHRKWALEEYEQSTYKPEEKIHLTSSGVYVRSKSEALISEKLFDRDVPNRYEQIIRLEGKKYAPDFTFRDFRGEWFFWEHAGKMNEVKYVRRHLKKMSVYERCGIVPWKNLIVTYDTLDGGINMAFIDSIIRYQILPRL